MIFEDRICIHLLTYCEFSSKKTRWKLLNLAPSFVVSSEKTGLAPFFAPFFDILNANLGGICWWKDAYILVFFISSTTLPLVADDPVKKFIDFWRLAWLSWLSDRSLFRESLRCFSGRLPWLTNRRLRESA